MFSIKLVAFVCGAAWLASYQWNVMGAAAAIRGQQGGGWCMATILTAHSRLIQHCWVATLLLVWLTILHNQLLTFARQISILYATLKFPN